MTNSRNELYKCNYRANTLVDRLEAIGRGSSNELNNNSRRRRKQQV